MYFAINNHNLIISYGKESYPGSVFFDESDLPDWWYDRFIECRLGYTEDRGFYAITEEEVALMGGND
jgi:hypothetical protein